MTSWHAFYTEDEDGFLSGQSARYPVKSEFFIRLAAASSNELESRLEKMTDKEISNSFTSYAEPNKKIIEAVTESRRESIYQAHELHVDLHEVMACREKLFPNHLERQTINLLDYHKYDDYFEITDLQYLSKEDADTLEKEVGSSTMALALQNGDHATWREILFARVTVKHRLSRLEIELPIPYFEFVQRPLRVMRRLEEFTFEDIFLLKYKEIERIFVNSEFKTMAISFLKISERLTERMSACIGGRTQKTIDELMIEHKASSIQEVEAAQRQMVELAEQLAAEGEISLP